MEQHGVDGASRGEKARHEGQPHGQVVEHRVVAHARPDERCLVDEARLLCDRGLGVELEHAAMFKCLGQCQIERSRRGEVPRHHDARLRHTQSTQAPHDVVKGQDLHGHIVTEPRTDEQGHWSLLRPPMVRTTA